MSQEFKNSLVREAVFLLFLMAKEMRETSAIAACYERIIIGKMRGQATRLLYLGIPGNDTSTSNKGTDNSRHVCTPDRQSSMAHLRVRRVLSCEVSQRPTCGDLKQLEYRACGEHLNTGGTRPNHLAQFIEMLKGH